MNKANNDEKTSSLRVAEPIHPVIKLILWITFTGFLFAYTVIIGSELIQSQFGKLYDPKDLQWWIESLGFFLIFFTIFGVIVGIMHAQERIIKEEEENYIKSVDNT